MEHFGIIVIFGAVLTGYCSRNDRFFTNADVLGTSCDIVVRDGVILQCSPSGSM